MTVVRTHLQLVAVIILISLLLSGCGLFGFGGGEHRAKGKPLQPSGPRLADLAQGLPATVSPQEQLQAQVNAAAADLPALVARYRQLAVSLAQPGLDMPLRLQPMRLPLARRLADLEMTLADQQAADDLGADASRHYQVAVVAYQDLLETAAGSSLNTAAVHYQLARAHDLLAEPEAARRHLDALLDAAAEPVLAVEARFRRGELAFSAGDWQAAADDFTRVAQEQSTWQRHARYMAGWAWFKAGGPDQALPAFLAVLADVAAQGPEISVAAAELRDDTLRATVLGLADLDGVTTLAAAMASRNRPDWQEQVYAALGDWYLTNERWQDSARTWETFISENPLAPQAPAFHLRVIATLRDGGFPSGIAARKQQFVEAFSAGSAWQQAHGAEALLPWRDEYTDFVDTLARTAHAAAQDSNKPGDWLQAARWYQLRLATLGDDPAVRYLLGDVLAAAQEPRLAIAAWQDLLGNHKDHPRAPAAGYGVALLLVGLAEEAADADAPDASNLLQEATAAQLAFAAAFPTDARAPGMQVNAALALFQQQDMAAAVAAAGTAKTEYQLTREQSLAVGRVLAHGTFDLADYPAAEQHYQLLLQHPALPANEQQELRQRLLAAAYRQGESAEAAGDLAAASMHFLRLDVLVPGAPAAVAAQFDAAALLVRMDAFDLAAALLSSLRQRHPNHNLAAAIPARLADLFQRTGALPDAAAELELVAQAAAAEGDREQQRVSRYRAAELWLEAGDTNTAIDRFRDYAHSWSEPMGLQLEAMHHMDQLYQQTREPDKRRFWLGKIIQRQAEAGDSGTERSRWLAADAALVLAQDAVLAFNNRRLGQPLGRTLKRKQQAMGKALTALNQVVDYRVAEFADQATVLMAGLYLDLSVALMDSPAPKGLNALEQEQYQMLLEEQAFPFEEKAIDLYQVVVEQARQAPVFGAPARHALAELARMVPGRWRRMALEVDYVATLY